MAWYVQRAIEKEERAIADSSVTRIGNHGADYSELTGSQLDEAEAATLALMAESTLLSSTGEL